MLFTPCWQIGSRVERSQAWAHAETLVLGPEAPMPADANTLSRLSFKTTRALPARRRVTPGPAEILSDVPPGDSAREPASVVDADGAAAEGAAAGRFGTEEPATRRPTGQRATCGANTNGLLTSSVVPVMTLPFTCTLPSPVMDPSGIS